MPMSPYCMSIFALHVHLRAACLCKSMSVLHVNVRATCQCFCCIYMSMLHVHVHAACPCPCCMSMSMLHVDVHAACKFPCCMFMSMLHVSVRASGPMSMILLLVSLLHVQAVFPCRISILIVYAACPVVGEVPTKRSSDHVPIIRHCRMIGPFRC